MRVLHTSDWHLGARLCDRERTDEQKEFLHWLKNTVQNESIDILLISGDIFDSTNPPNSAEMLYYNFLHGIKDTNCSAVVITGGNHDSVSKLNSTKNLLRQLSVFVNGGGGDTPENDVATIKNLKNEPIAVICAVPFLRERDIHIPKAGESWQEREFAVAKGIAGHYSNVLNFAKEQRGTQEIPIIAMGHLFVTGSTSGAGERDLYVGNLGSINADMFLDKFDYTALGHIHKSQKIGKRDDIRYSGSPLHMDFGESGEKYVLIAEFENSSLENVLPLKVPVFRELVRFFGTYDEVSKDLEDFTPPACPFWADAEIIGGDSVGDISKLLNDRAGAKGFEFLRIRIKTIDAENILNHEKSIEINDLSAEEVFLKKCTNSNMDQREIDELIPLYKELILLLEEESEDNEN